MRFPHRLFIASLVSVACLGSAAAASAKDATARRALEGPVKAINVAGRPYATLGTCTLGSDLPPAFALEGYLAPPGDQYYTLLDPSDCASCSDTATVTAAHIVLFFQTACSQPIQLSIVGVSADDPSCDTPDPANVIMPAATYMLDPGQTGAVDFTLPLDEPLCLTEPVFLCYTIDQFGAGCDTDVTAPLLVAASSGCETCKAWNFYDTNEDDFCVVAPPFGVDGPFIHYADADCGCTTTPTLPTSWGSLKIRYSSP